LIDLKVKIKGSDYDRLDSRNAERDFNERIKMYEGVYEPMCSNIDEKMSFIKLINVGKSYIVNRIQDHIQVKFIITIV